MVERTIATYFSHSYRPADQPANEHFWKVFDENGFYFSVDPPSDVPTHTHLERMMNQSSCYVAVVNVRAEAKRYGCSPFILSEFGLSLQAQRPRLLLVDKRVSKREPFSELPPEEIVPFSANPLSVDPEKLATAIAELKKRALRLPDPQHHERGSIGFLVPRDGTSQSYGGTAVRRKITKAAELQNFDCREIRVPFTHNGMLALQLRECEAVVLDVRGDTLPPWVFAYVYGRLIPSIKVVQLRPMELPSGIALPPLVEGLRMDEDEPGVESVIYWRTPDDLLHQLSTAFVKLAREPTRFRQQHQGLSYFRSIGRRRARVFVSNGSATNPLAGALVRKFTLNNIETFHYKEENAIKVGSDWKEKIESEAESCDVFVALIGQGYAQSEWCMKELEIAMRREASGEVALFPYNIHADAQRLLGKIQTPDLHNTEDVSVDRVFDAVDAHLKSEQSSRNWEARQPLPLGASREAVIDALRHLPEKPWTGLIGKLAAAHIDVHIPAAKAKIQSRDIAEELVFRVQRAEIPAAMAEKRISPLSFLVQQLAVKTDNRRKPVLRRIAGRMRKSFHMDL